MVARARRRLASCTDRNGNQTTREYNEHGQLVRVTDDRRMFYEIEYYAHGRVQRVIDRVWSTTTPRVVEYLYDSDGNLTEVKAPETARYNDANAKRTTHGYGYDADHRLTECTSPREVQSGGSSYLENTYDADGRIVQQRLGGPAQNFYVRYPADDLVRVIDRRGLRTDYTLNANGQTTRLEAHTGFWEVPRDLPLDHDAVSLTSAKLRTGDPDVYVQAMTYNASLELAAHLPVVLAQRHLHRGHHAGGVDDDCLLLAAGGGAQLGRVVIVATDGEEAVRVLEDGDVDLVVSDLVMPRLSGGQLYEHLKAASRSVKFLLTSGYQPHEVAGHARPDPQVPFLPKPWELRDLLTRVREVLDA